MTITLRIDQDAARPVWHAISTAVQLMDQVEAQPGDGIPPHAPLYGQRARLIEVAQQLDHIINETERVQRAKPRCTCPCGRGTDPGCVVHP